MAGPAVGSWWIGWGVRSTLLSTGTAPSSARAGFGLVLAVTLGLALLGTLIAVVITAHDVTSNNRQVEVYRGERRDRLSVIRRLEAERLRTDEVTATLADLARFFDGPPRPGEPVAVDVVASGTAGPGFSRDSGADDEWDHRALGEGKLR